jgi:nitrite reductase (NO-forming)
VNPMRIRRLCLALLAATVLAACGGNGTGDVNQLSVQGTDTFRFEPATITTSLGRATDISLVNVGALEHALVIDEFDYRLGPIAGGQTTNQTFSPNLAGSFVFYCDVPGHREAGMEGTLVVNP